MLKEHQLEQERLSGTPAPAMPGAGGKIVRRTATDLVLDALRMRILSGAIPPGAPLRQELLAQELGVSRIPVREALRLLSAEGLADTIPHRGAFVSMLSKDEVREFFDIRCRLEPWLLREAIPNMTEERLRQAEALRGQMDEAQPHAWGKLNWELHQTLYEAAQRPAALEIVRTLHERTERYLRFQIVNASVRQQAHDEHQALIDLCRRQALDQAEQALVSHIEQAAQQILSIVDRLLDGVSAG